MPKLSTSHASKVYLERKCGKKSQPISKKMSKKLEEASVSANEQIKLNNSVYNQSNAHSNETVVCEQTPAERFINNIEKMRNPHIRDCVSLSEKSGSIEDYSEHQEQRDLEKYKSFINSSAYDEVKEEESSIEEEIGEPLTLAKLRKISGMHDD